MKLAAFLLVLLATAAPARAEDATIAVNFQDVEIPVLARFVSEVTGRNFIVDDRVRGKVSIISPTRVSPDEVYLVFQSVLQVKGFTTVPSGAFTKIVPIRDARESGASGGDEVVTRILPLAHADALALIPVLQPLVSKDGLLTAYPPRNSLVVVDAAANVERITALLRDLDGPSAGTLETVALRYASAPDLAESLRDGMGADADGKLTVVADARTNTLVLGGPAALVRRARAEGWSGARGAATARARAPPRLRAGAGSRGCPRSPAPGSDRAARRAPARALPGLPARRGRACWYARRRPR